MTRSQIGKYARFLIDEHGLDWLEDENSSRYTLDDALDMAYNEYALQTRSFISSAMTLASTANDATYTFDQFGTYTTWGVNTVKVLGDIVVPTTANGHKYICVNAGQTHTTTEPTWGTAKNSEVTDGVVDTITWKEYGSDATLGSRVFEIKTLAYNSVTLTAVNENWLDNNYTNWRFNDNGTPRLWVPWGERGFRLYPKPSGTDNIYLEGYEIPELGAFDADSDVPDIHIKDHELLAVYAAIMVTVADPTNENQIRGSVLAPMWESGINAAKKRISGTGQFYTVMARNKKRNIGRFTVDDDITLLSP